MDKNTRTKTKRAAAIALATAALATPAYAKPPAGANPLYAPFFESLKQKTPSAFGCCGQFQDCFDVDSRSPNQSPSGHWEAFIDRARFGRTAPDKWVQIPDGMVDDQMTTLPRPPRAIACWYNYGDSTSAGFASGLGGLLCFRTPETQM